VTCSELATRAGTALGTLGYMSPEQAQGRLEQIGLASDIYGLGATLYALLTRHAPVEGSDEGEAQRRVSQGDWPLPSQVANGVPAALEAMYVKAMALRPEARYASVLELVLDVEHYCQLGAVGSADLRALVDEARSDLDLVERRENIDLTRAVWIEGKPGDAGASPAKRNGYYQGTRTRKEDLRVARPNRPWRATCRCQERLLVGKRS
jgi:serine/threonine protein kinase